MSLDDGNTDEYIVTALQIFENCGVDAGSTLRVDVLMDQFAPFVKANKAEYSYLRSLLDPEQSNPEITVPVLAASLNKYSESQKIKVDLEESFNLKSGQVPHDSDSGISNDGFQLLEDLQCELREKSHLAHQLRTQLDYSDRHHEEALATVTAERDSLRAHLNMLRDENMTLSHVRRDYEDVCERLGCSERALDEARRELDRTRRRAKTLTEQVTQLETEKLNLQELLSQSKDECHHINDMYASRQSSLLEENEILRTEHADLSARMRDQEKFMQQIIKEKMYLEMELKDMLNKSNQNHHLMERSIEVSYTEDQMLTALDSLNADRRFPPANVPNALTVYNRFFSLIVNLEGRLHDEESLMISLSEDQGRPTNMSLFDEIRLSFCNMSRHNITDMSFTHAIEKPVINEFVAAFTQTDDKLYYVNKNEIFKPCNCNTDLFTVNVATQTNEDNIRGQENFILDIESIQNNISDKKKSVLEAKVDESNIKYKDNLTLAKEMNKSNIRGKENIILFDSRISNSKMGNKGNVKLDPQMNEDMIRDKERRFNQLIKNRKQIRSVSAPDVGALKSGPYRFRVKDNYRKPETKDQTTMTCSDVYDIFKDIEVMNIGTQTDTISTELSANNNNVQVCFDCTKCVECDRLKKYITKLESDIQFSNSNINEMKEKLREYEKYVTKLESDIQFSNSTINEMQEKLHEYEENLNNLSRFIDEGNEKNDFLKAVADSLRAKLVILEGTCTSQGNKIDRLFCDTCSAEIQTESEQSTVSTQVETPCADCVKRSASHRGIRKYLWEPLKSLFQLFAVLCFGLAIYQLWSVTRRWHACRDPLPWQWLQPADLLDLFLTIEYVSDVPM